jgi:sugar lactone lactonase YvrE
MDEFEELPKMAGWHETNLSVPEGQRLSIGNLKPNYNITFNNRDGEVARFDFNGPTLQFTGNAEEGALLFIDWAMKIFDQRLKDEYIRGYNDAKQGKEPQQ